MGSAGSVWQRSVSSLLRDSRLAQPSSLADVINAGLPIGVEITLYLVDGEQLALRALPRSGRPTPAPLRINTTLAGRAFTTMEPTVPPGRPDRLWLPLIEGSERLGVLELHLPDSLPAADPSVRDGAAMLGTVIGHLLVTKTAYGDSIRRIRRSRPMATEGELLWRTLPPLTCATTGVVLAAVLEPCYQVGGDAFDYAVDHDALRMGVFDAVGHGLAAALTSTLTLAATRAARTEGRDLPGVATAADEAIAGQSSELRYVTAILAELDLSTGVLRYLNAGHPAAVLLRGGKVVATLDAAHRKPLGIPDRAEVAGQQLQPGDRLLFYTDGITEARDVHGDFFGLARLLDLAERHTVSGLPAPESLRRLSHAVLDHQRGRLHDDATLMIVEWSPDGTGGPATPASAGRQERSP